MEDTFTEAERRLDSDSPGDSAARTQKTGVLTKLKSGRQKKTAVRTSLSSRGDTYKSIYNEGVGWKRVLQSNMSGEKWV